MTRKRRLTAAQLADIRRRAKPIWQLGFGLDEAVRMAWEGYRVVPSSELWPSGDSGTLTKNPG